jgi:hypothetical protein
MSEALTVTLPAAVGSRATIDQGVTGVITCWGFYGNGVVKAYVEWWNGEEHRAAWVEDWRLAYGEPRVTVGF